MSQRATARQPLVRRRVGTVFFVQRWGPCWTSDSPSHEEEELAFSFGQKLESVYGEAVEFDRPCGCTRQQILVRFRDQKRNGVDIEGGRNVYEERVHLRGHLMHHEQRVYVQTEVSSGPGQTIPS